MKINHIAVNIALDVSIKLDKIPDNRIIFDDNHHPHITFLQFFTRYSNINKIAKILENIEIPEFNCEYKLSVKGENEYLYSIDITSKELVDFQKKLEDIFKEFMEYPENYKECFCEEITYDKLPELVYNFKFNPHITIGISSTKKEDINFKDINILKLDLYKIGNNGTAIPIIKSFFYCHRINTIAELDNIDNDFGVELDIRDKGEELVLVHDPYKDGELFSDYLKKFNKKSIILNIKSERVEYKVLEILKDFDDYFFLDSSFPMIYQLSKIGERKIAIRFSEYEPLEGVIKCKNIINWVWVDCFSKFPLDKMSYDKIKEMELKICIVSPELQGHSLDMISEIRKIIIENNFKIDAICTKYYNIKNWI